MALKKWVKKAPPYTKKRAGFLFNDGEYKQRIVQDKQRKLLEKEEKEEVNEFYRTT